MQVLSATTSGTSSRKRVKKASTEDGAITRSEQILLGTRSGQVRPRFDCVRLIKNHCWGTWWVRSVIFVAAGPSVPLAHRCGHKAGLFVMPRLKLVLLLEFANKIIHIVVIIIIIIIIAIRRVHMLERSMARVGWTTTHTPAATMDSCSNGTSHLQIPQGFYWWWWNCHEYNDRHGHINRD